MSNATLIARCTLVWLFALSNLFLAAGCYVQAADIPGPTLALQSLRELKEREIWVIGTDADAKEDLYTAQWPAATAWVLGAEGDGMRRLTRETCDQLVTIPMLGSVQSLNVSVASGVCLYEARRRRGVGMKN